VRVLPGNRWRVTVVKIGKRLVLRVRDRLLGQVVHETIRHLTLHQTAKAGDVAKRRQDFLNSGAPEAHEPVEWAKAKVAGFKSLEARRRPATVACYRHVLAWLERYTAEAFPARSGGWRFVEQIDAGIAEGYVAWRRSHVRRVKRCGEATINRDLRHFRGFWTYLRRLKLAASNPWVEVPMLNAFEQERTRLTLQQVGRLVKAAKAKGPAFRAALALTVETGPRIAELSHVTWPHLDLGAGVWRITLEPCGWLPKGSRERSLRFSPATAGLLAKWHSEQVRQLTAAEIPAADAALVVDAGRVFGRGRTAGHDTWERDFNSNLRAACGAAGVPVVTCHGLRRTVGRLAKDAGAAALDIQDLLGHADFATTQAYIGEGQAAGARAAFEVMQGRLGKKQVKGPRGAHGQRGVGIGANSSAHKVLQ